MGSKLSTINKSHVKKLNKIKSNCALLSGKLSTIPNGDLGELFYEKLLHSYPEINLYFWNFRPSNIIFSKMITRLLLSIASDDNEEYKAFFGSIEMINQIHSNYRIILPAFECFNRIITEIVREKFGGKDAHNIAEIFSIIISLMEIPDITYSSREIKNFLHNHKFAHQTRSSESELGIYNIDNILADPIMHMAVKSFVKNNLMSDFVNLIDKINAITDGECLHEFLDEYDEQLCSIIGQVRINEIKAKSGSVAKKNLLSLMKLNLSRSLQDFHESRCLQYAMIVYE